MKAIQLERFGAPDVMELAEVPDPVSQPEGISIRVMAAGVNFHDLWLRLGFPGLGTLPLIQGIELAGEVIEVGPDVPTELSLEPGTRVTALPLYEHGAYAELAVVPAAFVYPIPDAMTMQQAAAFPINYLMAHAALNFTARPRPGERVLIHGAAGGVGLAAVQLARPLGVQLYGTASASKHEVLREEGVAHPIDYRTVDFEEEVNRLTGGEGVDVVLDGVGEEGYLKSLRSLGYGGRLVCFGISDFADDPESLDDGTVERFAEIEFPLGVMNERARAVMASHLGAPPEVLREWMNDLLGRFEAGQISPRIDRTFPLADAASAHQYIHDRRNIGKVVLTV
jgi:NADPH:quinone reductase-like Zn-dependent oxidoreductase